MVNRLSDACARELENHIRGLFKSARKFPGRLAAEIPVVGGIFLPDFGVPPCLLQRVCKALCAREHFRQDAPAWAPDLPLKWEACKEMADDDDPRISAVGYYSVSLHGELWDPQHPPFCTFVAGLLASAHAPHHLRNDLSLQREFTPRPLEGLSDGPWLNWRSRENMARDLDMLARIAAWEADRAAGGS